MHDEHAALNKLIGEQVIHVLGMPAMLFQVKVLPLWGEYYRINVLVGSDICSARVANSYFVKVDSDGRVIDSTPNMVKRY